MVQKILYFFGGSAISEKRNTHPANEIAGAGRVGRGLMKGGGVLLGRMTAAFLVEESQRWKLHHRRDGKIPVGVDFWR